MHLFDGHLVGGLNLVDFFYNSCRVASSQRTRGIIFLEVELDVTALKVVVVDPDLAAQSAVLDINKPLSLPLTSPVLLKVQVDTGDVNLDLTSRIETKCGTSCVLLVSMVDVLFDSLGNSLPIK